MNLLHRFDPLVAFDLEEDIPSKITDVLQLMDTLSPGSNFSNRRNDCAKKNEGEAQSIRKKRGAPESPGCKTLGPNKELAASK